MKSIDDVRALAIFGGEPLFSVPRMVGRPNIGSRQRFLSRVEQALDSKWLSNAGPFVDEFEQRLAAACDVKHAIAVANGTLGLELVLAASELSGEVIVPSYSFVATAHAVAWRNMTPVFVDIDPVTHTVDPRLVEDAISEETEAILAVHLWGQPAPVEELEAIAATHGLKLYFDAAHAFGCRLEGKPVGSFGDAEVFSFHATKFVNSLEGGAITTDDDELAERIRLMMNFGFAGYDNVVSLGTNAKMNEISAAMGITSMESMDEFVAVNKRNYDEYDRGIASIEGLSLFGFGEGVTSNYQYVVVEVDEEQVGLSRDDLVDIATAEGARVRRYFYPGIHRFEPYVERYPDLELPVTEAVSDRVLVLPTGTSMSTEDVKGLMSVYRFAVENAETIRERIAKRSPE
jgi:dTDP-4-amino-4,6-dideoxygalactose transaminase